MDFSTDNHRLLGFDIDRDEMKELRGTLDPEDEGFFAYSTFLELCALKMDREQSIVVAPRMDC